MPNLLTSGLSMYVILWIKSIRAHLNILSMPYPISTYGFSGFKDEIVAVGAPVEVTGESNDLLLEDILPINTFVVRKKRHLNFLITGIRLVIKPSKSCSYLRDAYWSLANSKKFIRLNADPV